MLPDRFRRRGDPLSEIGPYRFKPGQISETLMHDYADEVRRPDSQVKLKKAG